jgi:glycerol-3-phosphate acyltransferase PlsY
MHSYFFISLIVALLVIWKHRTNITRLLKGEESKINQNQ